jgi:hypothetical protein
VIACLLLAVAVVNSALPAQESAKADSIVPESEVEMLLQADLLAADEPAQTSAEAAAAKAKKAKAQADRATKAEEEWTQKEADFAAKGKELNEKERSAEIASKHANAAADATLRADTADAMAKIAHANKASAEAQEEYDAQQAKYAKVQADMAAGDEAAQAKAQADMKAYNETMAGLANKIQAQKDAGKAILANMKAEAENLASRKANAQKNYDLTTAANKASFDAAQSKLQEEEKEAQGNFSAAFKSNLARKKAAIAAVRSAFKEGKQKKKAAKGEIDKRYKAKAEAAEAAELAYQEKKHAEAVALNQTRAATKEMFEKKAAQAQKKYELAMANASAMNASAHHAEAEYEQDLKAGEEEQAQEDKDTDATLAHDSEMASCKLDGSECQNPDFTCITVDDEKGPFMADDLVSCTDTKPADQHYAGESWAGVPAPAPLEPIPDPSPECLALREKFEPTEYGQLLAENPNTCGFVTIACHNTTDYAAKKQAYMDYFETALACPMFCFPGTENYDSNGDQMTHGICVTEEDVAGFKMQIEDLPVYKAMGTNDRFAPGPPADLCRMAKQTAEGFMAGFATPAPTGAPTAPDITVPKDPMADDSYSNYDLPNATKYDPNATHTW